MIVLLALLHLGVKNIHLGPTLPAFLSPNVAKVLVENFGIAGIGTVEDDLKLFFDEADVTDAVTGDMIMGEILRKYPETAPALMECGMHCLGCPSSQMETLADACMVHGLNVNDVLKAVNDKVNR